MLGIIFVLTIFGKALTKVPIIGPMLSWFSSDDDKKSSANLDKCMLNVETINKKSRTKSLSETLSIEFSDGFLNPRFFANENLSISKKFVHKSSVWPPLVFHKKGRQGGGS